MKQIFAKTTEQFKLAAKISDDRQKLFIDAEPVGDKPVSRESVVQAIAEFAPKSDLHMGVIDDIAKCLSQGEAVTERRIAKGLPPENGADGKILYLVKKLSGEAELKIDKSGRTDYHEVHLFDNVQKGQTVGRVYHPKVGKPGLDALGESIAAKPGEPVKLNLDKTILLQNSRSSADDFDVLIADDDGYLSDQNGQISVKTELLIKDDLDYRYGNIDFVGAVKVSGDVLPGFNIKAKKGIEIKGSVRGGSLVCTDGDIVVHGFVYGGSGSRVISGRSFTARVVQEINAEIIGNITIQKESINSSLRTESSLFVPGGRLLGGICRAVCGVEAKFIGNDAGQTTTINLCSDIETHTEYQKLIAMMENYDQAKKLIEVHLGPYATNPDRIQLLKGAHHDKLRRLSDKLSEIEHGRISLLARKKSMLEKAKRNDTLRVNYLAKCYQGTVIEASDQRFSPLENLNGPGSIDFIVAENKFIVGEMKPLVCTIHPPGEFDSKMEGGKK